MPHLLLALITAVSVLSADLNGTWRGTLTPDGRDPGPALLVLRQDGTSVTGTVGESEETDRHPIRSGTIQGDRVTFDIEIAEGSMKFELTLKGDELTGEVTRERDGQTRKAMLAVKRSK